MRPILWSLGLALALTSVAAWSAETRHNPRSFRPESVPHTRPMPPSNSWHNRPGIDNPRPDRGHNRPQNGWNNPNRGPHHGWGSQGNGWGNHSSDWNNPNRGPDHGWSGQGNGWGNHNSGWNNHSPRRDHYAPSGTHHDRPQGVLRDRYPERNNILRERGTEGRRDILRSPLSDDDFRR